MIHLINYNFNPVETALSFHVISKTFCPLSEAVTLKFAKIQTFAALPHISVDFQESKWV